MNLIKNILKILRNIIALTLLILLVIFMVNNRQTINIDFTFFNFSAQIRIFTLMISCFTLGVLTTFLILSQKFIKNFFYRINDQHKIKKLQKQIQNNQLKI
jgi:uncharacterized membrane protein YciS (DUF1049 family)